MEFYAAIVFLIVLSIVCMIAIAGGSLYPGLTLMSNHFLRNQATKMKSERAAMAV
jgi:pantothenate kinase type III